MPYLLALDQGTTSSRAILFDSSARVVGIRQREFPQLFPRPGWVEHDPEAIWRSQLATGEEVLAASGVSASQVAAIGITNQRETTVVWDARSGNPIHPAIVWQDRRTADTCKRMQAEGHEEAIRQRTGLVLDPYFSATKIAWILDHVDGARSLAEAGRLRFGTIDSWLVHRLTAGHLHVTDPSNASRTLLYDLEEGAFSTELLEHFGIPASMLPEVCPSAGVLGEVACASSLDGIPIAALIGDQQAALFGQDCTQAGLAKCTYGTGCFLLRNTGHEPLIDEQKLLATVAWQRGDRISFALEGSVFVGGAVVQWLRDGLGLIERASDVEQLANEVDDTGGVVFVPAFAGLGAPHWDPLARGILVGLTRGTTAAHIARAALASMAHQVTDVLEAMDRSSGEPLRALRVDGGAVRNDTLLQMQADVLGRPVARPEATEITALGAARLAGEAIGCWRGADREATEGGVRVFEPQASDRERRAARARWADALGRARDWARP